MPDGQAGTKTKIGILRGVNARMAGAGVDAYREFLEAAGQITDENLPDLVAAIYAEVEWTRRYLAAFNDPTTPSSS